MTYGLFDTVDQVWLGDDTGPALFSNETLARVAAQVLDTRLRQQPGRTRATPYTEDATRLRDEVTPAMSAEEALARLERGLF